MKLIAYLVGFGALVITLNHVIPTSPKEHYNVLPADTFPTLSPSGEHPPYTWDNYIKKEKERKQANTIKTMQDDIDMLKHQQKWYK